MAGGHSLDSVLSGAEMSSTSNSSSRSSIPLTFEAKSFSGKTKEVKSLQKRVHDNNNKKNRQCEEVFHQVEDLKSVLSTENMLRKLAFN